MHIHPATLIILHHFNFHQSERKPSLRAGHPFAYPNIKALASASVLKTLALERLQEAECLIENGHFGGAYYIGGYAIELALKAVVCKKLDIEIFDKETVPRHITKSFMIHDLSDLIILAGMTSELEEKCQIDGSFQISWSLVSDWSEQRRYEVACQAEKAKIFVFSLKLVIEWLQKNW
jgi:hypothetical protein